MRILAEIFDEGGKIYKRYCTGTWCIQAENSPKYFDVHASEIPALEAAYQAAQPQTWTPEMVEDLKHRGAELYRKVVEGEPQGWRRVEDAAELYKDRTTVDIYTKSGELHRGYFAEAGGGYPDMFVCEDDRRIPLYMVTHVMPLPPAPEVSNV